MILHPATAAVVLKARKEYGHEWWIGNLISDEGGRHRGPVTFFFTSPISVYILHEGGVSRLPM